MNGWLTPSQAALLGVIEELQDQLVESQAHVEHLKGIIRRATKMA